ncbi:hypothetical protein GCM10009092_05370 [Bowmanella denitrificans]|uniref:HTH cro/C1-type domain-containing protein n=1 Tax=Bowmanella denitrificans TaxID=366582 RepID=A0ABP3GES6_9ALTE
MTFGEKIKQLRNETGLSQPQLATAAEIEQSYLSKLENDRSLPSTDVFRRLLQALNIELSEFLGQLDKHYVKSQLSHISDVENWLLKRQAASGVNSRRWLFGSSLMMVLAVTLFFSGYSKVLFSEDQYRYLSKGIVLPGEPMDLFDGGLRRSVPHEEFEEHFNKLILRYAPHELTLAESRGAGFHIQVEGGSRYYNITGSYNRQRLENAVLQIIGVGLLVAGLMGFILEYKLQRRQS